MELIKRFILVHPAPNGASVHEIKAQYEVEMRKIKVKTIRLIRRSELTEQILSTTAYKIAQATGNI